MYNATKFETRFDGKKIDLYSVSVDFEACMIHFSMEASKDRSFVNASQMDIRLDGDPGMSYIFNLRGSVREDHFTVWTDFGKSFDDEKFIIQFKVAFTEYEIV